MYAREWFIANVGKRVRVTCYELGDPESPEGPIRERESEGELGRPFTYDWGVTEVDVGALDPFSYGPEAVEIVDGDTLTIKKDEDGKVFCYDFKLLD